VNADTSHALYASASDSTKDEIDFQIAGAGVQTITPLSALPAITNATILDGTTQPGFAGSPLIVLNGSSAGAGADGLDLSGGNSTVRGLVIGGFAGSGIVLSGGGNNVVAGNYIGTDATGEVALANSLDGVRVLSSSNLIGGSAAADRNVISGNAMNGVLISAASGNQVEGNIIGLDASGSRALGTDNNRLGNHGSGVYINAGATGNTVGGLTGTPGTGAGNVISGNGNLGPGDSGGVLIFDFTDAGTSSNVVDGNIIGLDATGTKTKDVSGASFANPDGVLIAHANHITIGGTVAGARNVISNNAVSGVRVGESSDDVIAGNYIGTDVTGKAAMGNALGNGNTTGGIWLQSLNSNILISGTTPDARNVISGNGRSGIAVTGALTSQIEGNYIGTDACGNFDLGNQGFGIDLEAGSNNVIGGVTSNPGTGAGNVISANRFIGVFFGNGSSGSMVEGNLIGLAANDAPLGNLGPGVQISNGNATNAATIGGTTAGAANVISANGAAGVLVADFMTGNPIRGNSIFGNARLGIDLAGPYDQGLGVTPNDSLGHVGGNNFQNFPVLTTALSNGTNTTITGTFSEAAEPNTFITLDFYANASPDPSGYGEGQTYLGSAPPILTDSSGNASFTASLSNSVPLGQRYISATATVANSNGTFGDTSEFAKDLFVPFNFSGFRPPLAENMAFALNRTIPIKWQLTDVDGSLITSLSAVTSLQVAPVLSGGGLGTPFNPTSSGNTALRNDGSQYIFNWQTKGLTSGTYEILLTLADGTVKMKVVQLSANGSSAGLVINGTPTTTATGALLGGDITLYVDNTNGDLTADELARIQDAVTAVDAVTAPFGVAVAEVTDPTQADVSLNMDTTSALGGYTAGVLGCTTDAGQITIINGWNFYAGSDTTQISSTQYDFETVVIHELGHALGLGHSTNSASVMLATLNAGTANRALTVADLNVPDTGTGGACGLHAAVTPEGEVLARVAGPSTDASGGQLSSSNALVFSMTGSPNIQVILAPTAAPGSVAVEQNLPGVGGNSASIGAALAIEAASGSSGSQPLLGDAAAGNSVSTSGPDAKQSFAEERSQTEFGNEIRNEGDEEAVPAAPVNEPPVGHDSLIDRLYDDAGADGYWTAAFASGDSAAPAQALVENGVSDAPVALAVVLGSCWLGRAACDWQSRKRGLNDFAVVGVVKE
jgi:hypothetical protein